MIRGIWTIFCFLVAASAVWPEAAYAGRLEAGSFVTTDTISGPRVPTPVTVQQDFDEIPIVVALSDQQGGNSASIRITDITTTGFQALVIEPDSFDGRHIPQNVQYIAVEPGRHILPGGTVIEAGRTNTSAVQRGPGVSGSSSFTSVSFSAPLGNAPAVLPQIQTANSETRNVPTQSSRPHITALAVNANTSGFQLALERSQSAIGNVLTETVGWIAFPAGVSDSFDDISGSTVNWGASNSSNSVRGWSDGCFTVALPVSSATRIAVAKKRTRNNGDGGWFRSCSLSASSIGLRVDEDTDQDDERNVAAGDAESAAIIAFSRPFHANLRGQLEVTKTSVTIALAGDTGFSIPGATREYLITVENIGNAPADLGTVVISDLLPPETAFLISDIASAGAGPVEVTGTALSLGLSYTFSNLASGTDNLDFADSSGFGYVPSDSGDGSDSNVAMLRVTPSGFFEGNRGSGAPQLSLRYRVRIR